MMIIKRDKSPKQDMNRSLQELTKAYNNLKESESRYKRLVEGAPDISYIFGTRSGAKFWSPQVETILGISPSTFVKDPFAWFNAIHPDDKQKVKLLFSSLNKNKSFSIEYRIKDKHGKWHWLNDRSISIKKMNGEFLIEGLAQDITAKKETEQELIASEDKFRKAFMTSPDSININRLDDGTYVSANRGFTKITGYTEEDTLGKTSLELNIWEKETDRKKMVNTLKEHGVVENLEATFCAKNGKIKYGLMSASLINLNGEPHVLSITRDITERVAVNDKLLKNQLYLEKAQELGQIGAWEMDIQNNILTWTKECYKIFELSPDTYIDFDKFVQYFHPEDKELVLRKWGNVLRGEPLDIEHRIITKEGNIKWIREKATIEFDNSDKALKAIGFSQDITERKDFERALKNSEEKYRLIVERANDGIEISQDNKIIYSNQRFSEILGYSQEEIKDISFSHIFSEEAKKELQKRYKLRQKGEIPENQYETTFLRKDGKIINVSVNYQIIDFNNKPATFAIIRDISTAKQMEKELRKLSAAVKQSPSIIAITDTNGNFEYVNPKFMELTGFKMEEVLGKTPRILKSGVLPKNVYEELWRTILSGNTWRGEFRNKKKNGELYWENAAITPIIDSDGKTMHFLKVAEDITEWKNIENALRLSEEKYRLIVENANDGIIISQNDQFIYTNNRFAQMLGYDNEELNNISFKEIYTKEATKSLYERHEKRERGELIPCQYETTFKKKDGSIIIVDVNYQIIDFQNGNATFAIIRDITDQKQADQALKEALKKAKESDHLKSAFLANMSHEIRTPMNGIMGFAQLLRQKDLSGEKQEQYLDIIEKSSKRMLNIINDLIDISKIESGQMELHSQKFNLNEMIDFVQNFFEPECTSKGIELISSSNLSQKDAMIVSDKDKLEAILINLLKNAIKFTHHGEINFGYKKEGDNLAFFVKDTGIGIPRDKQKQIFDRFVQADSSMTKPYEGAGLGLSISKAFVEMLGGNLELDSTVNSGSLFYFSIPYINHFDENIPPHDLEENDNNDSLNLSRHNLKVIIAEDDEPSFLYLNILMQPFCRTIIHARNGSECVELCKKHHDVNLILMDVKMPIMGGYDATKAIRAFNRDVIVVAQTAYAFSDDQNKILESGCNDYITKPIQENALSALIDKYFST